MFTCCVITPASPNAALCRFLLQGALFIDNVNRLLNALRCVATPLNDVDDRFCHSMTPPTPRTSEYDATAIAREVLEALSRRRQIAPFSDRVENFELSTAYKAAAELAAMRGEPRLGRKIGFSNRAIWERYGVDGPMWGEMTAQSVRTLGEDDVSIAPYLEPRLEPEIALKLRHAPDPFMDDHALLQTLEWIAPAFEIVQSVFPDWKFSLADCAAAGGLHGALLLGPPVPPGEWAVAMDTITVRLFNGDEHVESGVGANALGGPLEALRHLMTTLTVDGAPPLRAGEVITTGTLTDAQPIFPGDVWTAEYGEAPLSKITARFS